MSRSGYSDEIDSWESIRWRGAVVRATRGKRGQEFLRELLAVLDAMPTKELISDDLLDDGEVCAIGAIGVARGVDMTNADPEDHGGLARMFGVAPALVREILYENDDGMWGREQPEARWRRMRAWVASQITPQEPQ